MQRRCNLTQFPPLTPSDYYTEPHIAFTVVPIAFDTACPLVQELFRRSRGRDTEGPLVSFTARQRLLLWRHRSHQIRFWGEKNMRIIEPAGRADITVLKTDMSIAFLRMLSALRPDVEFVEFDSAVVNKRVQRHGLYVRKAGKIVRAAEASIGYTSRRWAWREEGRPRAWEETRTYGKRYVSQRQSRASLADHMIRLGFDPVRYHAEHAIAREARFRGGAIAGGG